jgi:hypothetical protein
LPHPLQIIDVIHPGRAPVSKKDLVSYVAKLHKADAKTVVLFGFKTAFGACASQASQRLVRSWVRRGVGRRLYGAGLARWRLQCTAAAQGEQWMRS